MGPAIPLPPAQPPQFFGYPIDVEGLAGTIRVSFSDHHADFFTRDMVAVLIEQDLRPVAARYAAWFPARRDDLATAGILDAIGTRTYLKFQAQEAIDRFLRPWTRPDDRGWPEEIVLSRTLHVLGGLLASVRRRLLLLRWRYKPKARTLRALLRHDHPDAFPRN